MVVIREVLASDYLHQIHELTQENWEETGFKFDLKISPEMIDKLQSSGIMFCIGAFDVDRIVGYSTAIVSPHYFNPDILFCSSSALFCSKAYRGKSVGARLMMHTKRVAKERGAKYIMWHTRAGTGLAASLKKRGAIDVDTVVMEVL